MLCEDSDFEEVFRDSTIFRAHQHAAGAPKKTDNKVLAVLVGGLSTKIHAAVDGLGNLTRFRLTGGERHDITEATNLIDGMKNVGAVVADKAPDAASLLDCIEAMNATAVIPPKANRKVLRSYDKHVYKSRNLIERFFARLKQLLGVRVQQGETSLKFVLGVFFLAQAECRKEQQYAIGIQQKPCYPLQKSK